MRRVDPAFNQKAQEFEPVHPASHRVCLPEDGMDPSEDQKALEEEQKVPEEDQKVLEED